MKKLLLLAAFALTAVASLNLNELCHGTLFQTLSHPTDQSLFIGCVQGKGQILRCTGEGEVFDPFYVACVTNDIPTLPPHDALCANVTFGWFPHEENCELYVVCEFSRPHVRKCPEGNIFYPYLPGCVPGDPETCTYEHHTVPPTTQETESPTSEATTLSPTTVPPPTEPITTVPPTTIEATTLPPTTQPPFTTVSTTTGAGDIIIRFECPVGGFGNIPHQSDCTRYFECRAGIRFPMTCPDGLIFDAIKRECGPPETSLCANYIRCG